MKLIEYMALGKCVVAPDQANIREILDEGTNGLLFRADDAGDLRRALASASADAGRRAAIGREAAATVERRELYWSANARRTLELVVGEAAERGPAVLGAAGGTAGVE